MIRSVHVPAEILEVEPLAPDISSFRLALPSGLGSSPGQFVMVWVPGVGEAPISVAWEEGREVGLVVARRGSVTSALHSSSPGDRVHLRGPLGRGFSLAGVGRALLVCGGYGCAPLLGLARRASGSGVEVDAALGFRSAELAILVGEFGAASSSVLLATDDGSAGIRGTAVDAAERMLRGRRYDAIYASGPEPMLVEALRRLRGAAPRFQLSLERLIRCGLGLCGACEVCGWRVCSDGPVLDARMLVGCPDLGVTWRDRTGRPTGRPGLGGGRGEEREERGKGIGGGKGGEGVRMGGGREVIP